MAESTSDTACAACDSEGAAIVVGMVAAVDISGAIVMVATSRGRSDAFVTVLLLLDVDATSAALVVLLAAKSKGVGVSTGASMLLLRSLGLGGGAMILEMCGSMKFEASAVQVLLCDE